MGTDDPIVLVTRDARSPRSRPIGWPRRRLRPEAGAADVMGAVMANSAQRRTSSVGTLSLPLLGFGCAPIGNLYEPVSDDNAQAALSEAVRRGICYFDTA